ncbi:hypothetical protein TNCV_4844371 [Trichonephila clavipes]|uniref:Uncharacterized protein n=1 Tax=Trichonephila clavipes TaxID=2585209 RepID=A0A8X6WJJ7_TRICX|nr:hypothetical protein TNCV_4844371 [Trichonephila clavipes]
MISKGDRVVYVLCSEIVVLNHAIHRGSENNLCVKVYRFLTEVNLPEDYSGILSDPALMIKTPVPIGPFSRYNRTMMIGGRLPPARPTGR